MRGISGCPVNPSSCVITVTALAPRAWVINLPPTIFSFGHTATNQVGSSSLNMKRGMIESHLLSPFDLNHLRVVNDDFDGAEPNAFQCEQDCPFNCPIGREANDFLR